VKPWGPTRGGTALGSWGGIRRGKMMICNEAEELRGEIASGSEKNVETHTEGSIKGGAAEK